MSSLRTLLATAAAVAMSAIGVRAFAQAAPPKALVVSAVNQSAQAARRAADVLPGDTVRYDLRFTNTQRVAVRNVTFDNPVPTGMRYVAGSAGADRANVSVTYSIDGGRTYSAEPTVQRVVDGRRVNVPAGPEQYTHIRWIVQGDLPPGGRVTAVFRAQLPARGQDQPAPDRRGA